MCTVIAWYIPHLGKFIWSVLSRWRHKASHLHVTKTWISLDISGKSILNRRFFVLLPLIFVPSILYILNYRFLTISIAYAHCNIEITFHLIQQLLFILPNASRTIFWICNFYLIYLLFDSLCLKLKFFPSVSSNQPAISSHVLRMTPVTSIFVLRVH